MHKQSLDFPSVTKMFYWNQPNRPSKYQFPLLRILPYLNNNFLMQTNFTYIQNIYMNKNL
jgi:hypothetical protein